MELLIPFANTGEKEDFSTTTDPTGKVSLEKGFTELYELKPEEGGLFILRKVFNQMMNLVTTDTVNWKTQTFPNWIADKGDGLPYSYPKNAIVKHTDGNTYVSKVDNNTSIPTDTDNWENFETFGGSDRIGLIDYGYIAKPYHIVAFGGEFNRADYPLLWNWLQGKSFLKTEVQWQSEATANGGICGFYSSGNGTTTFRVPNLDKAFLRPNSRGAGSYQEDSLKSHSHGYIRTNLANTAYTTSGSNRLISYSDSVVQTELTGSEETRPKNIAVLPLIVAK